MQNNPTTDVEQPTADDSVSTIFEETPDKKPQPQKNARGKVKLTPPGKPKPKNEDDYVTPRGMELGVIHDKHFGLYYIELKSPGKLPKELRGKWTEEKRAREAVDRYLQNYWKGRS